MKTTVVRYQVKPERGDENQQLVENVFAELAERQPDGIRYATFRLDDGVTFVHIATEEADDAPNPLGSIAAFAAFQAEIADRCAIQPIVARGHLVGSYRQLAE